MANEHVTSRDDPFKSEPVSDRTLTAFSAVTAVTLAAVGAGYVRYALPYLREMGLRGAELVLPLAAATAQILYVATAILGRVLTNAAENKGYGKVR
jgi:hypothetical protein